MEFSHLLIVFIMRSVSLFAAICVILGLQGCEKKDAKKDEKKDDTSNTSLLQTKVAAEPKTVAAVALHQH